MATEPTDPANYRTHPMGYACRDCNASAAIGQAVLHSGHCDIAPKQFVLPSDQAEGASSKRSARRGTSANAQARMASKDRVQRCLAAAAKAGEAALDYTDTEIAIGVRNGEITESDAMNQDA